MLIWRSLPIRKLNGLPYENTEARLDRLFERVQGCPLSRLVPADHFVDRRDAEPLIYLSNEASLASLDPIHAEPAVASASTLGYAPSSRPYF
jgi:hypothetical protein